MLDADIFAYLQDETGNYKAYWYIFIKKIYRQLFLISEEYRTLQANIAAETLSQYMKPEAKQTMVFLFTD